MDCHPRLAHRLLALAVLAQLPLWAAAQTVEVVHSFTSPPARPRAGLIEGSDGALYGTSWTGGSGLGTVYRITSDGQLNVLHAFTGNETWPMAPLVQVGSDLFGTTTQTTSGSGTALRGSVFRLRLDGTLEILHSFGAPGDGIGPQDGLALGSDGLLYGTTEVGGIHGRGTLYRTDPGSGSYAKLHDFGAATGDGQRPRGGLIEGEPGVFYGVTSQGGASGLGTLYRFSLAGGIQVLHSFTGAPEGRFPVGRPYIDAAGNVWGTTGNGGTSDCGTVFRRDALLGVVLTVHRFGCNAEGAYPFSGLVPGPDGRLWGTTGGGFSSGATVFSLATSGPAAHQVHHVFVGQEIYARGQLVLASDGHLYGTTEGPGKQLVYRMRGLVFETVRDLAASEHGWFPQSLAVAEDGTLYGTTGSGGEHGLGTAFGILLYGDFQTIHAFADSDLFGRAPGLTRVTWSPTDQVLYGVRSAGGASGGGTLFSLTPSGVKSDIFAFGSAFNNPNGRGPAGAPIEGSDGRLYGTTSTGGNQGWGTVYGASKTGALQTLAHLDSSTGTEPLARLVEGSDGLLYGATYLNGGVQPEVGSLFRIGKSGSPGFLKLHGFPGNTVQGYSPTNGMTEVAPGVLSGVASGGSFGRGVVFELRKNTTPAVSYSYSVAHDFAGAPTDGYGPSGEPVVGPDGFTYGVTSLGGATNHGVVYRFKPGGAEYSLVHSFSGADGWRPVALARGADDNLYGITGTGGSSGGGVVFRVRLAPVCDAGGPYTVDEGSPVTLEASCDRAATFEWDLDEDGDFEDATGASVSFPPDRDGPVLVSVRVRATDANGVTGEATAVVTVRNVAPTVDAGPPASLIAGETLTRPGTFTDPGPDDWTATVDYGDGSGTVPLVLSGTGFLLSHTYPARGNYVATVAVSDDDGGVGTYQLQVGVASAQDAIGELIDDVGELVADGSINKGQGNSLIAKLEAALSQLAKGNVVPARNQLQAFVNEVTAFIASGKLLPSEGQPLIDIANRVIAAL